jgi:DNA processing protein
MYSIRELKHEEFPPLLHEIPDSPKRLFCAGNLPQSQNKILCVVGTRKFTSYGKEVCENLIKGLRGYPVTIVSGLALGTDSLAHKAALSNNIETIAVPGSGLGHATLYPRSHLHLAEEIVERGGGLLSEFENNFRSTLWSFPRRNRIMAGMSHAVLVIESAIKSGTLITSRLATEYNRDVLTVPGSVFSPTSAGPHMLIRLGATPITSPLDLINALGFETLSLNQGERLNSSYIDLTSDEKQIIDLLHEPTSRDDLIRSLAWSTSKTNMIISAMEIKGVIKEEMGEIRLN